MKTLVSKSTAEAVQPNCSISCSVSSNCRIRAQHKQHFLSGICSSIRRRQQLQKPAQPSEATVSVKQRQPQKQHKNRFRQKLQKLLKTTVATSGQHKSLLLQQHLKHSQNQLRQRHKSLPPVTSEHNQNQLPSSFRSPASEVPAATSEAPASQAPAAP